MTEYRQVENMQMVRDMYNMSLINKDESQLNEYLARRNMLERQYTEINNIKEEVSDLKTDIKELKNLILQLGNK
jgi:protein subunit release factor B